MSFIKNLRLYVSILLDRQTPWYVKLIIGFGILYILVPLDLVPDSVPFMGFLDDVTIGTALVALALRLVPDEIIYRHKQKGK